MPICKTIAVTAIAALLALPAMPAGAQIVRMDAPPAVMLTEQAQWGRPGGRQVRPGNPWVRHWRGGPVRVRPVAPVARVGGYYGPRRYGYGRPYYGRRYYARPYYGRPYYRGYYRPYYGYYDYDPGAAIAAGIVGLAAGAITSSAMAPPPRRRSASWIAYCSRKYKSFNPRTGTYLGYDGRRHICR